MVQTQSSTEFDLMFAKAMEQPGIQQIIETLEISRRASVVMDQMRPVASVRYTTTTSAVTPEAFLASV
ncbi:hypothetical protein [Polaromonas sp.]|uniref:hypothetical protein n=1 Tax=Polaromonas sp. TaxID=1869339 RepID=UPI002FC9FBCC